jgi:hypothetical protein
MRYKKTKKYAKERGPQGLKDMVVWRNFKLPYISEAIRAKYIFNT